MNRRQMLVQQAFIDNEEAVIKRLKSVYNQSLKDINKKSKELQDQINSLDAIQGMISDSEEMEKILSMKQSKVYQKQYQDALKKQIESILDNMQVEEFKTVYDYMKKCYEDGFFGVMYDLHGQGIPLCFPIDQESIVRAVQIDSKISNGLYSRLGEDVSVLKKKIVAQVSRGIATGMSFHQVAQQLASYTRIGYNNAVRISRTEGHRVQVQSSMDACYKAKENGADIVKQWDSTLDKRTRKSHQKVDGEIRELDEPFSNGLMFPGDPNGKASEVINCRCALLERAKWALDKKELDELKKRSDYFGFDKSDNFEEFKKKYLNYIENGNITSYNGGIPNNWKNIDVLSDDEYKKVNPKYSSNEYGYRNNCPNCVNAYEMRKRGFDVIAKPIRKNHYLNHHPEGAWKDVDIISIKDNAFDIISDDIKKTGENSRFEVAVILNKYNNAGHVFVAENVKGKVVLIDPQSGSILNKKIFDSVSDVKYWRIDNAEPTDRCITSCESR